MNKSIAPPRAEINVSVFNGTYYALYMFIFLLAELVIQDRAAAAVGAEAVVPAYCVGLIATAAGYLLLPHAVYPLPDARNLLTKWMVINIFS